MEASRIAEPLGAVLLSAHPYGSVLGPPLRIENSEQSLTQFISYFLSMGLLTP